jgi:hypothetical protein
VTAAGAATATESLPAGGEGRTGAPSAPPAGAGEVVVLDRDEWRRRGLADGLRELGTVPGAHAPGPDGLADVPWARVGLVLVGVDEPAPAWDRFGGLGLARAARALGPPGIVTVAVTAAVNPLVALRAAEARVDHLYPRRDVGDLRALAELVAGPDPARSPRALADPAALRLLGLTFASRLTAGLELVEAAGLAPALAAGDGHGLSRRRAITLRRKLAAEIGVHPVRPVSAGAHQPSIPSWQQLRELIDLARGLPG